MLGRIRSFMHGEKGLGTVEIVIIIAILVGIALIFRNAIIGFVKSILGQIFNDSILDKVDPQNM